MVKREALDWKCSYASIENSFSILLHTARLYVKKTFHLPVQSNYYVFSGIKLQDVGFGVFVGNEITNCNKQGSCELASW